MNECLVVGTLGGVKVHMVYSVLSVRDTCGYSYRLEYGLLTYMYTDL